MTVELEFVRIEVNESFDRRLYWQLRVPIYQSRALVRNQLLGGKKIRRWNMQRLLCSVPWLILPIGCQAMNNRSKLQARSAAKLFSRGGSFLHCHEHGHTSELKSFKKRPRAENNLNSLMRISRN
jgi:hypothetical protein